MKPVACQVHEFSRANSDYGVAPAVRDLPVAPELIPLHVLVVDDEPLIRWSVSQSLSELGVDVEQAADAAEALRAITTTAVPFQVVVLDLRLPDMDDLSLLATLRQLLPRARLVLMTAFGTPELFEEAKALGASVLNKPFELDDLRHLVTGTRRNLA